MNLNDTTDTTSFADTPAIPMEYIRIPNVETSLSKLVLGTASFKLQSYKEHFKILDTAFHRGINTFDTASLYSNGESEIVLGKWIKSCGLQDKVTIISKCGHHNAYRKRVNGFDMFSDLFDSLARLEVDCIDIYLLHRDDESIPISNIMNCFHAMKKRGYIKAYGVSNWSIARIEEANAYAKEKHIDPLCLSSPHFSLARPVVNPWSDDCVTLSGDQEALLYYKQSQLPILSYASLACGFLSGTIDYNTELSDSMTSVKPYDSPENKQRLWRAKQLADTYQVSIPEIALAWVLRYPLNTLAIFKTSSTRNIKTNIHALSIPLTQKELLWLDLRIDEF